MDAAKYIGVRVDLEKISNVARMADQGLVLLSGQVPGWPQAFSDLGPHRARTGSGMRPFPRAFWSPDRDHPFIGIIGGPLRPRPPESPLWDASGGS